MPKHLEKIGVKYLTYIGLLLFGFLAFASWGWAAKFNRQVVNLPYSTIKPQIIQLDLPAQDERSGGIITADVNDDSQKDWIVTKPGHVAVYDRSGKKLWAKQINIQLTDKAEDRGLPGAHGAGVQAADVDGDRKTEVLFLTKDNTLQIFQGASGKLQQSIKLASPPGTERWEHLVVANFRGKGNRDLLLQATNADGYRLGRYLAAYALDDLKTGDFKPLWTQNNFFGPAHSGARVADLDGDGKDEVLGGTIVSPEGKILFAVPMKRNATRPHLDSIFVADVRPDIPGLEVVALEEGEQERVFLYNRDRLLWETHYKHQEPQNAAVGDFDLNRPGLEVWCRSRYNEDQKPFVFDAQGQLIADYEINRVAPKGWTNRGVEVIFTIDWTGESKQLAAAKERHESGDVAIFDPTNGQFLHRFKEKAARLYVADISGDWREELIVLNGNQLHVYQNDEPNPNPERSRLWTQNHYRHSKMTWNYYNP
jgi:hypothetical protein